MTIAGKETIHKVLKKDQEFDFNKATEMVTKNIIKAIDLYIEPKVIHDPHKTLPNIIAIPVADIIH
ncbi:hypothetical protein C2G38_2171255 [Gigaspora rosea]|uniref:Uncharacterized protein n=1 Tax=Gigaspora rosea TaxID=44941 RepID=A0A397VLW3_9GLOM|nr:hypothetical protein C2G38_2171255 [Gigaspora rosea]